MKKILIINSSIRKKFTYSLLKKLENLVSDYEVEFISIKDFKIKPCVGCENCILKGNCNIKDDAEVLLSKMKMADGIILGTPVYLRQISGYLKLLIDRGCAWYHRSPLVGKPIFFVTTTQVTGSKQAIKYLEDLSVQWGTLYAGSLSRTMFKLDNELNKNILSKFKFFLEDSNRKKYKPSLKQILEFNTQKVLAVHVLPLDRKFWEEKGYIQRPYFYDCKVNIFKRIIGYLFYRMLSYFIGKNKSKV